MRDKRYLRQENYHVSTAGAAGARKGARYRSSAERAHKTYWKQDLRVAASEVNEGRWTRGTPDSQLG